MSIPMGGATPTASRRRYSQTGGGAASSSNGNSYGMTPGHVALPGSGQRRNSQTRLQQQPDYGNNNDGNGYQGGAEDYDAGIESPLPPQRHRSDGSPPPQRRARPPTTFAGRFIDDVLSMPWDKVLAALMSGMLIYIGAARLHEFGTGMNSMKLQMQQHRSEYMELVKAEAYKNELQMNALELRIGKLIKQEIKNNIVRIDDMSDEVHDLDKRLALTEVRTQMAAAYNAQHNAHYHHGGGNPSQTSLPPPSATDNAALSTQLEQLVRVMVAEQLRKEARTAAAAAPPPSSPPIHIPSTSLTPDGGTGHPPSSSSSTTTTAATTVDPSATGTVVVDTDQTLHVHTVTYATPPPPPTAPATATEL